MPDPTGASASTDDPDAARPDQVPAASASPQSSKRVLNTRPQAQSARLSALLRGHGFEVLEIPLVEIVPHPEGAALLAGFTPDEFDALLFSSPNGASHFHALLAESERAKWLARPAHLISAQAASLWRTLGGQPAFVPGRRSLEGFLEEYHFEGAQRWLHPCSTETRLLPGLFAPHGITVLNAPVYRPGLPAEAVERFPAALPEADASRAHTESEIILFCSGSAVENAAEALRRAGRDPIAVLAQRRLVSIGPSTTRALRTLGLSSITEAPHASDESLAETVARMGIRL